MDMGGDHQDPATVTHEQRFSCPVCWSPRMQMVYGHCQHRVCARCLYDNDGNCILRACPMCKRNDAFPLVRPVIPEDNTYMQKVMGITKCSNERCPVELWMWELSDHLVICPFQEDANMFDSLVEIMNEPSLLEVVPDQSSETQHAELLDSNCLYSVPPANRRGKRVRAKQNYSTIRKYTQTVEKTKARKGKVSKKAKCPIGAIRHGRQNRKQCSA